jgi:hypothetical protein
MVPGVPSVARLMAGTDLLVILVLHGALTALPGTAVALYAASRGVRDVPVLLGIGLSGSGVVAMLAFWAYYADPSVGRACSYLVLITSACLVVWSLYNVPIETSLLRKLGTPVVLWALGSTFLVFLGFLHGGTDMPIGMASTRFSHQLPPDNYLPSFFSDWFFEHGHDGVPPVFPGTWLASDRPPLQMGYVLAQRPMDRGDGGELDYQVLGVILQQQWIVGLWALLVAAGVGRTTRALSMLVVLVSDLAIVNGFFVWPKMLAAAFVLAAAALVMTPLWAGLRRSAGGAALIAALISLAMLAHSASVFAVIPLAILGVARKRPGWRWLGVAALVGGILTVPWSAYQKYGDPPGNRLTKWMIGGFADIDERGAVETLVSAYRETGWRRTLHNKMENFVTMSGGVPAMTWAGDAVKAFRSGELGKGVSDLRVIPFFYALPSCGLLLLAPFAMTAASGRGRRHPAEWHFALTCFAVVLLGCLFWGLLMFGSEQTRAVIHTGSLALLVLAFCGAVAGLQCTFPRFSGCVIGMRILLTLLLYAPSLAPAPDTSYCVFAAILAAASLLGFAAVAFGLRLPPALAVNRSPAFGSPSE